MAAFDIIYGSSPVIGAAIHDGHDMRRELYPYLNLQEHERIREEDPYTSYLTEVFESRIVVNTSRFEVDMNRPRNKAIYKNPEDCWGLTLWKEKPPVQMIRKSLSAYDKFYAFVDSLLRVTIEQYGYFIVLDLHTYNHKREDIWSEEPVLVNPEINIGTESIHPEWHALVQNFIAVLSSSTIRGKNPDVRENVKFKGGEFSRWINTKYGASGCAIPIEFKKTFMEEWTGRVDIHHLQDIQRALLSTVQQITYQLKFKLVMK